MDRIALQLLLDPCASDGAVGRNLEYDSRHILMCQLAEHKPDQEYGDTVVAAEEPDWNAVLATGLELAQETRDLRVAVLITESLCRLQGFSGLLDGLTLIAGWLSEFWTELHPAIEDDDEEAIERMGILNRICHNDYLLRGIQNITLAQDDTLGRVTLRDLKQYGSSDHLTLAEIKAIRLACDPSELQRQATAVQDCLIRLEEIQSLIAAKLGTGSWNPELVSKALRDCSQYLTAEALTETKASAAVQASLGISATTDEPAVLQDAGSHEGYAAEPFGIQSRSEAIAMIDALCLYFETHEPASPVPLLLQRAKRLIPMSFVDILKELAPEGLSQAMQTVGGESPPTH